jgi:hypothetical protein
VYRGGLPLFALLSAALVASLQGPSGVRRTLSSPSLVAVGRRSYGIYVYHWPVVLWLDAEVVGHGGAVLALTRIAVTFALAAASYRWLEQPVRRRHGAPMRPFLVVVLAASLVIAASAAVVGADDRLPPAPDVLGPAAAPVTSPTTVATTMPATTAPAATAAGPVVDTTTPAAVTPTTTPSTTPATTTPATTTPVPAATVVAVFGDSVPAWMLRDAAPTFDRDDVIVVNGTKEGCDGFDGTLIGRDRQGDLLEPGEDCVPWPFSYPAALARAPSDPEVGVLMVGVAAALDRYVDGEWEHPCDGIGWYTDDLARRIEFLRSRDMRVVFALPAPPGPAVQFILPSDYEERYACVRAELGEFLATQPVDVIDLAEVLCPDDCGSTRVDGLHVRADLASDVLDWILDRALVDGDA